MKDVQLVLYITQLGLSVAVPLAGFVLLALWLRQTLSWGDWVLWVGGGLGVVSAIDSFLRTLHTLRRLTSDRKTDGEPPAVSFNDHD